MQWDLTRLYRDFEDPSFLADFTAYQAYIEDFKAWGSSLGDSTSDQVTAAKVIETYIEMANTIKLMGSRLQQFASLTLATDANHSTAKAYQDRLGKISKGQTQPLVTFLRWLKSLDQTTLKQLMRARPLIQAHQYHLERLKLDADHLLSLEAEVVMSRFKATGSEAWSNLQAELTATLMVPLNIPGQPEALPLQAVRNLAFSGDAEVRKAAFECELAAYEQIEQSSAAALNAIKGEVLVESELRGFKSPLDKTLFDARMSRETLEAMLAAVVDFLPRLRAYQKAKAKLLGYEGGLRFYDIHAPLVDRQAQGKQGSVYDYESAKAMVQEAFAGYSEDLATFSKEAFDNGWIDVAPKRGKRAGAFCSGVHAIKESRILLNFTGSLNNVITLAHELGHGYHGRQIYSETPLNASYSMPVAETASIFCETILKQKLIQEADSSDKLGILDASIQGYAQTIMDIYSRYLFETALFEQRGDAAIDVARIKAMMVEAQKAAYGDALDHSTLHPYMWANKVHYYYPQRNFYNFPYTFGLLFAKGLYAIYQGQGEAFKPRYRELLRMTGQLDVEGVAALADIDIRSRKFWEDALAVVGSEIDAFIALVKG